MCNCSKKADSARQFEAIALRILGDLQKRPSCLFCVEKHLSSAMVLIDETPAYPLHRLYVIGNLNEAEVECGEHAELRNAVRSAKIEYQREGTIPDFVALSELLDTAIGEL